MAAKDNSFDVVSEVDMNEVTNAMSQTEKEIAQRFDLKDSKTIITKSENEISIVTSDEFKLQNVIDILQTKLVKRNVSIKSLEYEKIEKSLGGKVKQVIKVKQGITKEEAKKITTLIKDSKLKVQASVQGDVVRVSGKNRNDLQDVMQALRDADLAFSVQFTNYR
ncbi:protein of unknown function DUF520 [Alkaliphilus metalliredigens QYMF]|uniref:Nucleotide-binding protein Amet_3462 n=1 Tax=Alkaliphilus metalliredigens (strain QYMF) TaxID=293826 RepID=A6TTS2_ALKMQ|nr:YajQ family cyclic di-GMP-binding protein [Alkaliphilus metalliredigens]ABR49590.1 protein of unknown function DUF520 [Alkaliphilus metalliredigens QYMF]